MADIDLFGSNRGEVVTMLRTTTEENLLKPFRGGQESALARQAHEAGLITLFSEGATRTTADENDLGEQFMVFQLSGKKEGPSILDATQVEPSINGSRQNPDVLVSVEMLSFHIGNAEGIEPNTKATLRMDFCKDESSSDKKFDPVFWSVAAGLDLYNAIANKKTDSKDLKANFVQAFSNRPIEIPGGLGRLTFQVVKHKDAPWWKQVFKFLEGDTAKALISTFGLPAVTLQVVQIFDNLLNRISESSPEVLFRGRPMRLAFSKLAVEDFTGGSPRVSMGVLNRGFCVFARGRDFDTVADSNAVYYPSIGKLVPGSVRPGDIASGSYDDPLKDVTYAVFRVGTKETKLDPTFNYDN